MATIRSSNRTLRQLALHQCADNDANHLTIRNESHNRNLIILIQKTEQHREALEASPKNSKALEVCPGLLEYFLSITGVSLGQR